MLTSSLKLSVLCERLWIMIAISGLLIVNHGFRFVKAELSTCRHGWPQVTCRLLCKSVLLLVFGLILWKWMNGVDFLGSNQDSLGSNQECRIGYKHSHSRVSKCLASIRKLGSSEGLHSFRTSKGTNLFILIILAGDIEMNPDFSVAYAKSTVRHRIDSWMWGMQKTLHASCLNLVTMNS